MSNGNYGQVAANAEILRQEGLEREYASRQPGALEDLAEQVERLQRDIATLKAYNSGGGGVEELVDAVKSYCDRAFDDMHKRIDELDTARRQQRLAFEEELSDLHRKVDDHIAAVERKAVKPKVQVPVRSANGIGKVTQ
jgi:prefoldin subunit 5